MKRQPDVVVEWRCKVCNALMQDGHEPDCRFAQRHLRCFRCGKTPAELPEYSGDPDLTPEEFCREEEGTLNHATGEFCCTQCYIEIGMPTTPRGWTP